MVALACQLPAATGVPLSRWSGPELKRELEAQALVSEPVSVSSLLRILAGNPVKPWQYQSWIFPRDPDFEAKASVILDLYQGFYGGEPLRPGDRIPSFDAKPSIQARSRIHETLPAAPGRAARVEHEYVRHGALALLAALDVHTGPGLTLAQRLRCADGTLRGPGEKQAVMTEPSGVRVTSPRAADPRGFCARVPALGRF